MSVLIFNRKKRRFKKLIFKPEIKELIDTKEFKPRDNQEKNDRLILFFKRVDDKELMPSLPEGLIRFPTLEELKVPPKKLPEPEPEVKVDVNPTAINVEGPKIKGEVGLPGVDIKGPKIEGAAGLPAIDIKGPKIEAGIDIEKPKVDVPGVEVDIQGPNIEVSLDLSPQRVILRGPKGKNKAKKKEFEAKVDVSSNLPSLGEMLDSNADANLNLPKVDVPNAEISGPKFDVDVNLEKPKIEEPKVVVPVPKVNIHGNLPSLRVMIDPNTGIGITVPQVEVPKVGDADSKKDIEVLLPNVGIDIYAS